MVQLPVVGLRERRGVPGVGVMEGVEGMGRSGTVLVLPSRVGNLNSFCGCWGAVAECRFNCLFSSDNLLTLHQMAVLLNFGLAI